MHGASQEKVWVYVSETAAVTKKEVAVEADRQLGQGDGERGEGTAAEQALTSTARFPSGKGKGGGADLHPC